MEKGFDDVLFLGCHCRVHARKAKDRFWLKTEVARLLGYLIFMGTCRVNANEAGLEQALRLPEMRLLSSLSLHLHSNMLSCRQ